MPTFPRVAILTPHLPSTHRGGVEVFAEQLAETLGGATVFAPMSEPSPSVRTRLGLEQPLHAAAPARALRNAWRANPYDLVVCNGLCGWPLTLAPVPAPTVEVYHFTLAGLARKALSLRGDRFTTGRIGGVFDRLAGAGKTVVSVSEPVRREVSGLYGHASSVLSNGVDVALFRRGDQGDARERLHLPQDAHIALFVGRAEYAKGFDLLQELARRMRDVLFLAVSAPAPGPSNLRFLAPVAHGEMPLVYAAADVFVLPSRYEGCNLSLLEALACELPAVTSAAAYPWGPESPPLATVVDPATAEGFAQAVRERIDRGPPRFLRDRMVREHSLEGFRQRWAALARELATWPP